MPEYIDKAAFKAKYLCLGYLDEMSEEEFDRFPTADVAPVVHARWVKDEDGEWSCMNCREVVAICDSGRERTYRKPYCPNCGAQMIREV